MNENWNKLTDEEKTMVNRAIDILHDDLEGVELLRAFQNTPKEKRESIMSLLRSAQSE